MKNKELIYDEEIAPKLLEIAKRCEELGISFVASVEYAPGERGRTEVHMPDSGFAQTLIHWAARCNGNIDSLFMTTDKHASKYGHTSIYLSLAGNDNILDKERLGIK